MQIEKDPQAIKTYLEDTANISGQAEAVYFAETSQDVSSVLMLCQANNQPITVSAGRTGTVGGCVAQQGFLLSLQKLNKIIEFDLVNATVHLEAGVLWDDLEKAANQLGLSFRPAPTEGYACVGGALATGACGTKGYGYGSVRNYVKEIELVLIDGQQLTIKRNEIFAQGREFDFLLAGKRFQFRLPDYTIPTVKSQAGYYVKPNMDLIDLFIGSEGTLGVITKCKLQLQTKPKKLLDGLVFFADCAAAFNFVFNVDLLKQQGKIKPVALEYFDQNSLGFLKTVYSFIPDSACAAIYFEEELEADSVAQFDSWAQLAQTHQADLERSIFADSSSDCKKIHEFRHKLPELINEFLRQHKQIKASADIAVPKTSFLALDQFYQEQSQKAGINFVNFGHIGQWHTHFNFLPINLEQAELARQYLKLFCQKAVSLNGTVSAEHGIGKLKKEYLKLMYNQQEIRQMSELKKVFDLKGLLGRDNIFAKELLG